MSESICRTRLPIRATLAGYVRDTYVSGGARPDIPDSGQLFAEGVVDCRSGIFDFDIAPGISEALRDFDSDRLHRYTPASEESRLREAILSRFAGAGVGPDQLFLGHGSFNLLERVIHKFLRPDVMGGVGPQFSEVPSEFVAAGGRYEAIPLAEPDAALPLAALEQAIERGRWSVLYLDNPNNPLGRAFPPADLERLAAACDRHGVVLLVDEAFGDYLQDGSSAAQLVPRYRSVIVVRSFSKALGLAAERIGYAFFSGDLARVYRQIDVPFEPGVVAQALACATLADPAWLDRVRAEVRRNKRAIVGALEGTGLRVLPTHPEVAILAIHGPGRDLVGELRERGVAALPGSSFAQTHPAWDDSYCRVRVLRGDDLALLCRRLAAR
jgi:histidinol-phosphate aminotransferase